MSLDLNTKTESYERGHFYLGLIPQMLSKVTYPGYQRTEWRVQRRDHSWGTFVSTWLFGRVQFYRGDAKVDGSRTQMYWNGQLEDGDGSPYSPQPAFYVYTDLPKELWAFRVRSEGPSATEWNNMGGA